MGVGLGAAVLPPLAQTLTGALGWRGALASLGLVTFLVTCPAAWVATRGLARPAVSSIGADLSAVVTIVRTRLFMLLCLLVCTDRVHQRRCACPSGASDAGSWTDARCRGTRRGVDRLAAIVGRGGLGFILDRVHASYVLATVALMAVAAYLLLCFAGGSLADTIAAVFVGMVVGAEVDFISSLVRRYFSGSPARQALRHRVRLVRRGVRKRPAAARGLFRPLRQLSARLLLLFSALGISRRRAGVRASCLFFAEGGAMSSPSSARRRRPVGRHIPRASPPQALLKAAIGLGILRSSIRCGHLRSGPLLCGSRASPRVECREFLCSSTDADPG